MYLMQLERILMIAKTLTPYKVIMKARPVFPYIGIVWARSKTQACREFANHLGKAGYSKTRTSPSCYETLEISNKKALKLKWAIVLNKPNGSKEKT